MTLPHLAGIFTSKQLAKTTRDNSRQPASQ